MERDKKGAKKKKKKSEIREKIGGLESNIESA